MGVVTPISGVFAEAFLTAAGLAHQINPVEEATAPVGDATAPVGDANQLGYKGSSRAMEDRRRQRAASGGAKASQAPSSEQTASTNAEVAQARKRNTLYGE